MTAGRPRKPNAAKERDGTYRPDRDRQLDLPSAVPDMPAYLSARGQQHWHRLAPMLSHYHLLCAVDGDALAMLCEALAEYQAACDEIENDGLTAMTDKGYSYPTAGVAIRSNAWKKVCQSLRQFGMTPSARAGMKVVSNAQGSDAFDKALEAAAKSFSETDEEDRQSDRRSRKGDKRQQRRS